MESSYLYKTSTETNTNATSFMDYGFVNATEDYSYLYPARFSTAILLSISVYVLLALLMYDIKTVKHEQPLVNHIITFSAANVVISCISQMLELFVGKYCRIYRWINAMTLVFGTAVAYTIIWVRQRSLYIDPLLKNAIPKALRWLSTWIIVGIYATLVSLIPLFVLNYKFKVTKYGCVIEWTDANYARQAFPILFGSFVATTTFQITLLGLVAYPLSLQLTSHGKRLSFTKSTTESTSGDLTGITKVIKKLGLVTLVCVLSSSLTSILVIVSNKGLINYFWSNFIAADLLINTVAHVCAFVNWRERLFPMIGSIRKTRSTVPC